MCVAVNVYLMDISLVPFVSQVFSGSRRWPVDGLDRPCMVAGAGPGSDQHISWVNSC